MYRFPPIEVEHLDSGNYAIKGVKGETIILEPERFRLFMHKIRKPYAEYVKWRHKNIIKT